jgi:flagellar basal body-associated protein FliL
MRTAVWWSEARVRASAEGEKPRRAASAAREDPRQKEALPVTIVWILIVIILVLLVIALARRVL